MKSFKPHHQKTLLILVIALLLWSILHEFMHAGAILLTGHHVEFSIGIIPMVRCVDCINTPMSTYALFAVAPYVIDLLVLAGYLVYRKYKESRLFWWAFHIAFLDVIVNYFGMAAYLFDKNVAIDFITMAKAGFWFAPLIIIAAALPVWVYVIYRNKFFQLGFWKRF